MSNPIKYSTGSETNALKKGNFFIGTGDVGKGPSDVTGYYQGVDVPSSGYTIYMNREGAPGDLSYHVANNDEELISFTNGLTNSGFTSITECFNYFSTQNDKVCLNIDYPPISTDGLILNLDSDFVGSFPKTGNTLYDVSLSQNNYILSRNSLASYIDKNIQIKETSSNQIRLDYNLNGDVSGIIVESGTTNYFPDNINYNVGTNGGFNKEIIIGGGPYGLNAVKFTTNVSQGQSQYRIELFLPQGYYTNTFYVNKNSNFVRVELLGNVQLNRYGVTQQGVNFNPTTGLFNVSQGVLNPNVESVGDWWKCSYTIWSNGDSTSSIFDYEATNFPSVIGQTFTLSGIQIEPGFKSTSLILTNGSTKTRESDLIPSKSVNFNTSGAIFLNFDAGEYYGLFISGLGVGLNDLCKIVFNFTPTSKKLYFNGVLVDSETGDYDWTGLNTLDLVGTYTGKHIKQILCYNRELSESECIILTS